jgi:hypothetical protein
MLFELGRTEKGIVYAARSRELRKVVALQMTREGDGDRFRTEADAAARVQHPGVLQVYETGEHDGRAFVAREYCPEGSLETKLGGTPLPPADAAALVARLAPALQAAHDASLVHGDLKPGNILIAEDGTPRVTGFGRTADPDDRSPSYLAPEQAAGKEPGPAADVYALGTILYECLTGRPPFRAATARDTLAQVMANHPAPPSQLNAAVPHELEAVAMKCLAKEPASRFASAGELGAELNRFAGGPITPRAPGAPARALGWVRQNPRAAAWAAVLVGALAVATAGSALLALDASAKATRMRQAEQQAEEFAGQAEQSRKLAEENARAARNNANKVKAGEQKALQTAKAFRAAEQKAAAAAEELEAALVGSLLRPVGHSPPRYDRRGGNTALLAPLEADALAQLGGLPDRVRLRVIEAALDDPRAARSVARRPDWVTQSAVGLDRDRRKQAESLVLASQPAKGPDQVLARARLGVELNLRDPGWAKQSAGALAAAIARATGPGALNSLAQSLNAVSERLGKADSLEPCSRAAEALAKVMSKATDPAALRDLARAQAAVGERLPRRIAAGYARKAVRDLVAAVKDAKTAAARQSLAAGLAAVSERLNEEEADKVALSIIDACDAADPHNLALLAQGLKSACGYLEGEAASRWSGKVVDVFLSALGKTTDPSALASLATGLQAVGGRLDAKESASLAEAIAAAAGKAADPRALNSLARALNAVGLRLEAGRAASHARLSGALVATLGKAAEPAHVVSLSQGLGAISGRLDAKAAGDAAKVITALLVKATDPDMTTALGQALGAVAERMDAKQAGTAAGSVVEGLAAAKSASEAHGLAQGLKALAGRLDAADADKSAQKLVAGLSEDTKPAVLEALAPALAVVLGRLADKQAAEYAAKVSDHLVAMLEKDPDSGALASLGQALEEVGGRLDAKAAAKAVAAVAGALPKTTNANALSALAQALEVLNGRLRDPIGAAKHARGAAQAILSAMKQAMQPEALHLEAEALEVVLRRLSDPRASALAAGAAAAVVAAASKSSDAGALYSAGQALKALGKRLDAREANQSAQAVVAAMSRTAEPYALDSLAQALVAVGDRLGERESNEVLEALVVLAARAADPGNQASLARALKAVGGSRRTGDQVAVLAHPLCAGPAQRALLNALGARCKREFENSRHFLDWAASNGAPFAGEKQAR